MKEEKNDLKARLTLGDGREAWRDGEGQFIDVESGAAVSAGEVEQTVQEGPRRASGEAKAASDEAKAASDDARSASRRHLLAAVRRQRGEVDGLYDAWGYVVGALTQIALDGDGAKATAAAKFVAQAAGMMEEEEEEPVGPDSKTVLGRELALGVLALGEKGRQDGEGV